MSYDKVYQKMWWSLHKDVINRKRRDNPDEDGRGRSRSEKRIQAWRTNPAGKMLGQRSVESGQAFEALKKAQAVLDASPEIRREAGRKGSREGKSRGGKIRGRQAVESGQIFNMIRQDTKPELTVQAKLDELIALGAISNYVHPYNLNNKFFVDFYVPDTNTMIEVDGCYWHHCKECGHGDGRPRDRSRNAYIKACGYELEIIKEHELNKAG